MRNQFVEHEEQVCLVAHEHAHDVLVVGGVQFLVRRLREGARERHHEQLEALLACLLDEGLLSDAFVGE